MLPDWQRYASSRNAGRIRERSLLPPARIPSELELQARWFTGEFGREFTTTAGDQIEIVQLGTWNREAGPDFRDASIRTSSGAISRGCIEIDLVDRSWETHGHATDPAFESTVLHIFIESGGREFFTRTVSHRNVPQIQLDLSSLRGNLAADVPLARPGRCHAPLGSSDVLHVESILAAAARFRLQRKADRFRRAIESHGRDEALYQAIAAALGYKNNQLPFTLLTQRLPLKFLQEKPDDAEALLFGIGGFLHAADLAEFVQPTRTYLRGLWDRWWPYRSPQERLILPRDIWNLSGSRPMNHPQRRLGALAAIVQIWPSLISSLNIDLNATSHLLLSLRHDFWSTHYTATSAASPKEVALIGETRFAELVANIFVPLSLAEGRDGWDDYSTLPAQLTNRAVETAATRLFGSDERRKNYTKTVAHQQGLLQIYEDFCLQDDSDCEHCPFPEQMQKWK